MSGWMSPNDLNKEPTRWLNIPHEMHETLLKLMDKMFPGYSQKLKDHKVHCCQCEGEPEIPVLTAATMEPGIVTGWIGDLGDPDNIKVMVQKEEE